MNAFTRVKTQASKVLALGWPAHMIIIEQNGTIKVENGRDGGAVFTIRFYKGTV